jgi:hypothetical protein
MDDRVIPPGGRLITREEYVEHLVEASMQDADEMEEGFGAWSKTHVPRWHELGHDESWIRQRVESAQTTRKLHDTMKARGFTRAQRREFLRAMYTDIPELYDMMIARERSDPHISIIYGTTDDLQQRYVLRMLLYNADKANYARHCRWAGLPESEYVEDPTQAFIRDLSTVEELEVALQMAYRLSMLYDAPTTFSREEMGAQMEAAGRELRAQFIAQHGYPPEKSTTPRIPVTPDGPADPEEYHARHRDK